MNDDANELHALSAETMLRALPRVLQEDPNMQALAKSLAGILAQRQDENQALRIYPAVDELPESLLDILAYDLKVDWWNGDYTVEQKRRTLKSAGRIHRMLGTKAAVEEALSAVYPGSYVEEWFEYGGEPYTFRLHIDLSEGLPDLERHERALARVGYYKNLRSHLEDAGYFAESTGTLRVGAYTASGEILEIWP